MVNELKTSYECKKNALLWKSFVNENIPDSCDCMQNYVNISLIAVLSFLQMSKFVNTKRHDD